MITKKFYLDINKTKAISPDIVTYFPNNDNLWKKHIVYFDVKSRTGDFHSNLAFPRTDSGKDYIIVTDPIKTINEFLELQKIHQFKVEEGALFYFPDAIYVSKYIIQDNNSKLAFIDCAGNVISLIS